MVGWGGREGEIVRRDGLIMSNPSNTCGVDVVLWLSWGQNNDF